MQISIDDKLKTYLDKKHCPHIVVDVVDSKTCCAGYSEVIARPATDSEAAKLSGVVRKRLNCDDVEILILCRCDIDDDIRFSLRNFLGIKDVTVKGIRAFSI